MKIVQISPPWASVPPKKYGGTELIVCNLTEELIKRGHQVALFASGDSKTSAKLIPVCKNNLLSMKVPWSNKLYEITEMARAVEYAEKNNYDLIHNHLSEVGLPFSRISRVPIIHTNHGWLLSKKLPPGQSEMVQEYKKDANFISIAKHMQKITDVRYIGNVYNSVDISTLKFDVLGGNNLVWIGRFTKNKGAHIAIKVANQLHIKLLLAAKYEQSAQNYFDTEINPFLNSKNAEWVGEIGGNTQKSHFLNQGKVFINAIEWEEPFGLVVPEANACGVPVVAFARGSMPELIKDGVNGYLIKPGNINGMIQAVQRIYDMPEDEYLKMRQNCRKYVEDNFTIKKMVDGYEKIYQKVINKY